MESKNVASLFRRLRKDGYSASFALDYAKTKERFLCLVSQGRARMRFAPDDSASLSDLGDGIGPHDVKKLERIAERDGWFGAIAEVRAEEPESWCAWENGEQDSDAIEVDAIWGFLGTPTDDGFGGPGFPREYELDMMRAAIQKVAELDAEQSQLDGDVQAIGNELALTAAVWEDATHPRAVRARENVLAFGRIVARLGFS